LIQRSASLPLTALLGLLLALTALGVDSFLPAMPSIAAAFEADPRAVQLAITTYLVGIAAGQLFWGPASDRFGRRPVLFFGLTVFFIASVAATQADSAAMVVALRFLQGLGMSSGPVVARSVVRDLVSHEQAARLLSRMMIFFCIVPIGAPLIAGVLAGVAWQAVFWFHVAAALALIAAVYFGLAETAPSIGRVTSAAELARGFSLLLRDKRFVAPLAVLLCTQCGIVAFVSASPFVMVQGYGVTPGQFSVLFAAIMLGQIAGAWTSSRLAVKRGIPWMLRSGAWSCLAAAALLAALAWGGARHWSAFVLPLAAFMFATTFVMANAMAAALTPFPQIAGAASALLGCLQFGTGAAVSALTAAVFDGSGRPLSAVILAAAAGAVLAQRFLFRKWIG
jgi:DHA1 family bicyclomycin/chloramphenicol resistance-like MFS transporter